MNLKINKDYYLERKNQKELDRRINRQEAKESLPSPLKEAREARNLQYQNDPVVLITMREKNRR